VGRGVCDTPPCFLHACVRGPQVAAESRESSKALRRRVRDSCKEMQRFVESLEVRLLHSLVRSTAPRKETAGISHVTCRLGLLNGVWEGLGGAGLSYSVQVNVTGRSAYVSREVSVLLLLLSASCASPPPCLQRHLGKGFHCGSSVTAVELLQGLSASLATIRASGKPSKPGKKKRGSSVEKVLYSARAACCAPAALSSSYT
jgi:hypothetical protein